ncbi:MAG: sugar kinase [Phenylobacterium sp.]|uniref:sugar kinase n=1 Tax=Phenylobacterium sp. TaxID=1871053 RepID=UPI00273292D3|nr:sugar kinase [Phenylobacterium sp.]MDP3746475.1 sugar kinase [Phenylobacterium sp.]
MDESESPGRPGRFAFVGEVLLRFSPSDHRLLAEPGALDVHVGGAEANVAVALARLGHRSRMITALPSGPLGDRALFALRGWGVELGHVLRTEGRMGLYFLARGASLRPSRVLYDREGSAFATTPPQAYDWPALFKDVDRLHLSGVTPALGPYPARLALEAVRAARAAGLEVSFDGNYRPQLWARWSSDPRGILGDIVQESDLLFGDHRDIALLLGREDFEGPDARRRAVEAAFAAFPRLKAVASTTREIEYVARHRIRARIDTRETSHETREVQVAGIVDRVGAGDAFAAGVLHALASGRDADGAVEAGLALTCLKHSLPGDAAPFDRADLAAFEAGGLDVRR